jgi:hypothetical protein
MDKRIVVVMDGWEQDSLYPHGHYVRTLGKIGDKATETVGGSGFSIRLHEYQLGPCCAELMK